MTILVISCHDAEVEIKTKIHSLSLLGGEDKNNNHYADIMEYSEVEEEWTRVGELSLARSYHGAAVVDFDQFKTHCQQ